jgi:hypothetical protein
MTQPNIEQIEAALYALDDVPKVQRLVTSVTRKGDHLVACVWGYNLEIRPGAKRWEIWHVRNNLKTQWKIRRRYRGYNYRYGRTEADYIAEDCRAVSMHLITEYGFAEREVAA